MNPILILLGLVIIIALAIFSEYIEPKIDSNFWQKIKTPTMALGNITLMIIALTLIYQGI